MHGVLELHQIDSQAGIPETTLCAAYIPPGEMKENPGGQQRKEGTTCKESHMEFHVTILHRKIRDFRGVVKIFQFFVLGCFHLDIPILSQPFATNTLVYI